MLISNKLKRTFKIGFRDKTSILKCLNDNILKTPSSAFFEIIIIKIVTN